MRKNLIEFIAIIGLILNLFHTAYAHPIFFLEFENRVPPFKIQASPEDSRRGIITDIVFEIFEGSEFEVQSVMGSIRRPDLLEKELPYWISYGAK